MELSFVVVVVAVAEHVNGSGWQFVVADCVMTELDDAEVAGTFVASAAGDAAVELYDTGTGEKAKLDWMVAVGVAVVVAVELWASLPESQPALDESLEEVADESSGSGFGTAG